MIEFIFTFFPSLIIGVIFIILGFKLKSNKENKYKNGVKARVVSIKVNEKRTKEGHQQGLSGFTRGISDGTLTGRLFEVSFCGCF